MQTKEKRKYPLTLSKTLLMIGLIPLAVTLIAVMTVSYFDVSKALKTQTFSGLKNNCSALNSYYGQKLQEGLASGGIEEQGDKVLIGGTPIDEDHRYIDSLTGNDVVMTLFYKDVRVVTSIKDETGKRIEGTRASEKVVEQVIENGQDYQMENLDIQGKKYYVYYEPFRDANNDVIGMCFAGTPIEAVQQQIRTTMIRIGFGAVICALISAMVVIFVAAKIRKPFGEATEAMKSLADGKLNRNIKVKTVIRETGSLLESTKNLSEHLKDTIGVIKESAGTLTSGAASLNEMCDNSAESTEQVAQTMSQINEGNMGMTENVQNVACQLKTIDEGINEISSSVQSMVTMSDTMSASKDLALEKMHVLQQSGKNVEGSIVKIRTQIEETNKSVQNIQEAITVILEISDQTNLLALNASIEAARAGEQGKGFAVVADEIKKLSEECSQSATHIRGVVEKLKSDFDVSVEEAQEVDEIVNEEQNAIKITNEQLNGLSDIIYQSLTEVQGIDEKIKTLLKAKEEIIDSVDNLSAISEENAASTEEVTASTQELTASVTMVSEKSAEVQSVSESLNCAVSYFK